MCRCGCPRPGTAGAGDHLAVFLTQSPSVGLGTVCISQLGSCVLNFAISVRELCISVIESEFSCAVVVRTGKELILVSGNGLVLSQDTDLPLGVQSADIGDVSGLLGFGQSAVEYGNGDSHQNSDDGDLIDEFVNDTSEVGDRLEKVFQNSPFLMKVWNLMKSWGHGNKAFRIIATLPLFALATQLAFRRRKYKLNYNTTEHVFIQAYIACQILLLSIIVLPFNGYAKVDDLYELPLWLIFVLFCWNYKQLYRCTWWRSFWRTILMLTYSLVLLVIFACLLMALMLAGIYVLKFIL